MAALLQRRRHLPDGVADVVGDRLVALALRLAQVALCLAGVDLLLPPVQLQHSLLQLDLLLLLVQLRRPQRLLRLLQSVLFLREPELLLLQLKRLLLERLLLAQPGLLGAGLVNVEPSPRDGAVEGLVLLRRHLLVELRLRDGPVAQLPLQQQDPQPRLGVQQVELDGLSLERLLLRQVPQLRRVLLLLQADLPRAQRQLLPLQRQLLPPEVQRLELEREALLLLA